MNLRSLLGIAVAVVACMLSNPRTVRAQTDVIRGRVTNAEGTPLGNVRVTATSIPGSVTRETRTDAKGAFRIAFPGDQGDYMMGYALVGYTFRQFEIKRTVDQDVLVADARLAHVQLDTVTIVAPVQQRVGRNSSTQDVSGTERNIPNSSLPPELQGNIAAMAASLPGVLLLPGTDGGPDGFSVLGLGADANSTTLNGMQFDGNGLPRDAQVSTSLTTSPYDASRGGFSGAQVSLGSSSGSNYVKRGMSLVANTPQLEWTDRAARSTGTEYTNLSFGGVASGPIKQNKSFYNISYQLGRNARDNQTLLTANALGLQTAGVSSDSVSRFLNILNSRGIPQNGGFTGSSRLNDNGSVFGSFDFSPPNSSSGSSYNLTFNGSWGRQSPVGGGITSLPNSTGQSTNWNSGVQARHNGYLKMILSETSVGFNASRNYGQPYLELPAGRVRVSSELGNGASGVSSLGFGGSQSLDSRSRSTSFSGQNTLSWFDDANKHRIKLTTELRYSGNSQNQSNNLLGSYYFNSLADLEAGIPASYNRQLTARSRSTGQYTGALSLGDSYRRSPNVQIQYGIRFDGNRFTATPTFNPEVEKVFNIRNDVVPHRIAVSPRVGFSWTLGQAREISGFNGAFRGPRAVLRGGVGVFANNSNVGQIGSALDNTGLATGAQQLYCVGEASPIPDWNAYLNNLALIPDRCADGTSGTVFSNTSPNVTLFSRNFTPQKSVRSNLSWSGSILDARFSANVEGTYSLNLNQQRPFDLNFIPTARFMLPDEDSRPVFVQPTSIVQETGSIASRDSRVTQLFSRVSEVRSDLKSQTAQLSLRISPISRTPTRFGWNAAYTYQNVREQVSGFSSTAGNPVNTLWSMSATGPHQISYGLRYNFFDYVQISWNGQFRSGSAYTPTIAGDVNGDGYSNDRAFIFDPAKTNDVALADGMRQLLANTSSAAHKCLEQQLGAIASRNSCRGPWSSTASLNIVLDRVKFRMPQRGSIQFSLSNPLGAADLALNGSGKLKGWGQNPFPDQSLLYVRGFDPASQRYKYEVNQRFGATRPQFVTLRSPVTLTVSMKFDLGPTRERQSLVQQLDYGRRSNGSTMSEGTFRSIGSSSILNPMSSILRQQDSLKLTAVQADSIAAMNRRYAYRADSLWTPVARWLAKLPKNYSGGDAYDRFIRARHEQLDLLTDVARAINDLLTPAQRRKLPASITNYLDPRFLASIRNGSGMYVSGSGIGSPSIGGFEGLQVFR